MSYIRTSLRALTHDGWAVLQLVLVAIPASFCVILALPASSFSVGLLAFAPMQAIMPEGAWAATSGFVAGFGLWSWFSRNWWVSLAASTTLSMWHSAIAACVFVASPLLPGAATYSWLAVAALLKIARPYAPPPRS